MLLWALLFPALTASCEGKGDGGGRHGRVLPRGPVLSFLGVLCEDGALGVSLCRCLARFLGSTGKTALALEELTPLCFFSYKSLCCYCMLMLVRMRYGV